MKIADLTPAALADRLRAPGITLQTADFSVHLQTDIDCVSEGIGLLYQDYPLADNSDFADFHVSLKRAGGIRRWIRPQVQFLYDGKSTFKPLPLDQAFPMLEWGLNWCVSSHANGYLIIHAAVIERNGFAAILPAPPGSGKSTLCAALIQRGWRLLSDELALIRPADGRLVPLPRPVSLKNASIDIMRAFASDAVFSRKVSDTMKGTVAHMKPAAEHVLRANQTAQPAWIVFPKYEAGAAATLTPVSRASAFMRVADNAFNYSLLGVTGFDCLANVVEQSHCYDFCYSSLDDAIATFAALEAPQSP